MYIAPASNEAKKMKTIKTQTKEAPIREPPSSIVERKSEDYTTFTGRIIN